MNDRKNEQYVFEFECAEVWENLTGTKDENIRHCQRCAKNVHLVRNNDEFISNAERGNCIYSLAGRTIGIIAPPEGFIKQQPEVKPKFMKRIFQFIGLFIAALPLVSFLPLYIKRTMIRSQTPGGDVIDYEWKILTLYGFLSDYNLFRPEEYFTFFLAVNLVLACVYAFVIALAIVLLLAYRKASRK